MSTPEAKRVDELRTIDTLTHVLASISGDTPADEERAAIVLRAIAEAERRLDSIGVGGSRS